MSLSLGQGMLARAQRGGSPWSPAALFGAGAVGGWYDPADRATLFQDTAGTVPVTAAGQSVARMNDKSGRAAHAVQTDPARCPQYQIDASGRPHLKFDGVNDHLIVPATAWGGPRASWVCGLHKLTDTPAAVVFEFGRSGVAGSFGLFAPGGNSASEFTAMLNGSAPAFGICHGYPAPRPAVMSARLDIGEATAASEILVRIDGAPVTPTPSGANAGTGNLGTHPLRIGAREGGVAGFSGRFYGLMTINRVLTLDEIASVERFIAARTGVAV